MQLYCQSCGALIRAEDISVDTGLAKCRSCHAVMNFAQQLGVNPSAAKSAAVGRPRVPQPEKLLVEDTGGGLRISWSWWSPVFLFLVLFCIAWDGFLIFWYQMAFGMNAPWIFKVFPLIHLAVGVGLTYFTIAGFLNRTTIEVAGDVLTVRHGPLPWPGNRTVPVADVEQFYCQEKTHVGRHSGPHYSHPTVSWTYQVCAVLKDGHKVTVLSGLHDKDRALFIEQQLEEYLDIPDMPIGGELAR
jgi:hypothetical protein